MLWDTHMHSLYSGDCDAPQEEMIRAAKNRRLSGICFTDHLDLDYPDDPDFFLLNLPGYTAAVRAAQQAHPGFPVRLGIELGLQPHLAAAHTELLARYPFDFVIGSSHLVCGADPYYPAFWENRSEEEGWLLY